MKCKDIMKILEEMAPLKYAENWDNAGLLLGREEKEIRKIMIALDATEDVIDQCVSREVDMLITHHPLLFSPINKICWNDFVGRKVIKLLQHDISYYAIHTNFDTKVMAEESAAKLELINSKVLASNYQEDVYKVAVYVPLEYSDKVREAMVREGAGHVGAYSHCTFNIEGVGTFRPLEGSSPFIGIKDEISRTQEIKIETMVSEELLNRVLRSMIKAHPYEEVAYDVFKLEKHGKKEGIGRYGFLTQNMTLKDLAGMVKDRFQIDHVKLVGQPEKKVSIVAISPGAGKSMVKHALNKRAEVLITGDIDHHTALDAYEQGLSIIDAGHFGTEYFMVDYLKNQINAYLYHGDYHLVGIPEQIEIIKAKEESPFSLL